jgi:hypothetical protein
MSLLTDTISDLREKRLWPVAAALLVALVAIPVLLSTSSSPAPVPATPAVLGAAVTAPGSGVPAVSLSTSAQVTRLTGKARDPFTPQVVPAAPLAPSSATSTSPTGGGPTGSTGTAGFTGSTGSTGSTSSIGSTTSTVSTGSSGAGGAASEIVSTTPPKPPVNGLSPTQSYRVAVSITNTSGGFDTIDPLERLGVLPSQQHPLLIELGVLRGGHRVLFAVEPGAVLSGPGTCTPGPIDCEILSLGQDQIEGVAMRSPTGVIPLAEFAVTTIGADQHSSVAAANTARGRVSATGHALFTKLALPALSLFSYEPSVGAVVDLRDLTVGGS